MKELFIVAHEELVEQYLLDHPEVMKQVEEKVFAALLPKPTTAEGKAKAEADKVSAASDPKPEIKPTPVPLKKPKANEELVL